jgi:hypothetical protein
MQINIRDYLSSISYVLLTALSFNFLGYISKNTSPFLILMVGCIIAIVFFHIVNFGSIKKIYIIFIRNKYSWLKIMIFILINWITAFLATYYGSAFIYIFFSFSTSAMLGIVANYRQYNIRTINKLVCFVVILLTMSLTCVYMTLTYSIIILMAIFFAIISGVSGYCYSVESAEFSKINNLTTSQILATRFWLLLIFSTAIVYIKGDNLVNSKILFYSCLVGLSTFIIPIYLFQHGVLKLGASRNAIIRGFTPVTTFIIQYIIHIRYSLIEFIVSIIFSIALVFSIIKAK